MRSFIGVKYDTRVDYGFAECITNGSILLSSFWPGVFEVCKLFGKGGVYGGNVWVVMTSSEDESAFLSLVSLVENDLVEDFHVGEMSVT